MHTRLFECFCNLPNSVRVHTGDTAGLCGLFHSSQLLSLCQSPFAVAEMPRWTVCSFAAPPAFRTEFPSFPFIMMMNMMMMMIMSMRLKTEKLVR